MLMPAPHVDQRRAARSLFFRGWPVTDIADELGIARTTIESWKTRDAWAKAPMIERAESCIEVRFQTLIEKEKKTGGDFKEIDLLGRQIERLAQLAAIRMGVAADAALAHRRQRAQLFDQRSLLIEQLLRLVTPQPVLH